MRKVKKKSAPKSSTKKHLFTLLNKTLRIAKDLKDPFVLLILWLSFCAVTSSFPSFDWMFPTHQLPVMFFESWKTALLILVGMILYVRFIAKTNDRAADETISSLGVKIGFAAAIGLSAFLCLYHMDKPSAGYTDDCAFFIRTIRRLKDLGDYGLGYIFQHGLLPAWPYSALALWHLLPNATGLTIQRLSDTLFHFGIIFFLYLSAKEIVGRRMALLVAGMAAVSKALISRVVSGYPSSTLAFGIAIAIWLTIRLQTKNKISDFLWWGIGVGFLAYTAAPFEPFIPFFIFISLGYVWWTHRKEMKLKDAPVLIWLSLPVFLVFYLCCNNAFPNSVGVIRQIKAFDWWLLAGVLVSSIFLYSRKKSANQQRLWIYWFLGSWLATIFAYPEIANDFMVGRIEEHSLISGAGFLSPVYLQTCLQQLPLTLRWLFWASADKSDMAIDGDAFFGYSETILIGLGLVFCVARPNITRVFLILTAILGVLPLLFATGTHSGFLIGSVCPLLLIGAIGLNELLEIIKGGVPKIKFFDSVIWFLLIIFWFWSAHLAFSRVYTQWAERRMVTLEEAAKDSAKGFRVYISLDVSPEYYEGPELHFTHEHNPIDLATDEKIPDVVIYMDIRRPELRVRTEKAFPKAKWSGLFSPDDPSHPMVLRCEIAGDDLLNKKQDLFVVSRIAGPFWKRTYIAPNCYLNLSLADWEDGAKNVSQPLPAWAGVIFDAQSLKLEGTIHINHTGDYEIAIEAGNRSKVFIDDKKIFDVILPRVGSYIPLPVVKKVSLNLKEGDHKVVVVTCFQTSYGPPDIWVKGPGADGPNQEIWKSFSF
jgi:hypothetical protein